MKLYIFAVGLAVVVGMLLVSLFQQSQEDYLLHDMKTTCERSYGVVDGALEAKCGQLIDKVQARGYEVLHNYDGTFWAEWNQTANN